MLEVMIGGKRYVEEGAVTSSTGSILTVEESSLMFLMSKAPCGVRFSDEKSFLRFLGEDSEDGRKALAERIWNMVAKVLVYGNTAYTIKTSDAIHAEMATWRDISMHVYFKGVFCELPKVGDKFDMTETVNPCGKDSFGQPSPREISFAFFPGVVGTKKKAFCL